MTNLEQMINSVYLRRKNKLQLEEGTGKSSKRLIATMMKNIQNLGYIFSPKVISVLETYSENELKAFYRFVVSELKRLKGAHVEYKPMYPNFPQQVMEASDVELFLNAIIHYWSFGTILPEYEKEERFPLHELTKSTKIGLGDEADFCNIFKNLLQSTTSLSSADKEDLTWFVSHFTTIGILPENIPLKENVALVANLLIAHGKLNENELCAVLGRYFKTATDVLRFAVALSNGDISLANNTTFKSFGRKQRKLMLSLLESASNIEEDMKRYKENWKRLSERLHPFEYQKAYPKSCAAFKKLAENVKIETFAGKLQSLIDKKEIMAAVELVKQRPGEFARKLDVLLRKGSTSNTVLATVKAFGEVADRVSVPVLLQVRAHFANRGQSDLRVFFPKGNVARSYGIENDVPHIAADICAHVVSICDSALTKHFAERKPLGKVYVDPALKNYLVPFSQRSASKALKTLVRGSRIDLPKNISTVRSFVYWKQPNNNRVDLDLSAMMFDEDWKYIEHISYTNLRSAKYQACHSGDITSAPNGASEFIDLDIESAVKYGARYIVICVFSYTGQAFADLPECFMGWMARKDPGSGEIYEPKTVQNKVDIAAAGQQVCIPMVLDLVAKQVIWADIGGLTRNGMCGNIERNSERLTTMGKGISELRRANLYDLFVLHGNARGTLCDDVKEADMVFSVEEGITPFEMDVIMGQFL